MYSNQEAQTGGDKRVVALARALNKRRLKDRSWPNNDGPG